MLLLNAPQHIRAFVAKLYREDKIKGPLHKVYEHGTYDETAHEVFIDGVGFKTPEFDTLCTVCNHAHDGDDHDGSEDEQLPSDYEVCGTCGYDHEYDGAYPETAAAIKKAHEEAGDEP